ncbi:UD11 glucuronosyltransferase, partial [Crypturellus soui]|nr:UD11 glucuronosyltransferase [Crypturellus soui]
MAAAALLPLLCCLGAAAAGKLLVVPMEGSHWLSMRMVLGELSRRGHEVTVVAPEGSMLIGSSTTYTLKTYPAPFTKEEFDEFVRFFGEETFSKKPFLVRFYNTWANFKKTSDLFKVSCESLLYNKELMKYIEESKFDAVFTDPLSPCGPIIALHFSIPSIFFLRGIPCAIDIRAAQSPDPPSYVPRLFSLNTDRMTFPERVKNLLISLAEPFLCNSVFSSFESLASEFLQKPVTITELLSHGSIWLKRMDFVFDYPMPVMPSMVHIGGINCGQKKPLSQ